MKRMFWLIAVLASLGLAAGRANACANCDAGEGHHHSKAHKKAKSHGAGCPSHMEGAEVSVTNTADGVTISITTQDPQKVKKLQEMAAAHFAKKTVESWVCPMGDGSGDKPGKCPKCNMDLEKKPQK